MTPAMNSGMKGQPQAGLAALAQPAQAPRGMSSGSMEQIIARAKDMSDSQLADILSGKSMAVPQYVAMTEAMGRKSLRTAMQGVQAQQQAKQPSLKDKLLAEDAQQQMIQMAEQPVMAAEGGLMYADGGIASLPAYNMDSVGMAGGGIVAFDEGGLSFAEGSETDKKILEFLKNAPGAVVEKFKELNQPRPTTFTGSQAELDALVQRGKMPKRTAAETAVNVKDETKRNKELEDIARGQGVFPEGSPALPTGLPVPAAVAPAPAAPRADTAAPKAPVTGVGTAPGAQPYSIPSFESLQGKASKDYLSKLESLGEKRRAGLAEIKKQGGGEALMQIAAAVMGSPNLAQAAAKGMPLVASTAGATRREARALESSADDYDLNVAKAREAAEKGDMALALQYTQLANQAKSQSDTAAYQQGLLGIHGQRNALMKDQYDSVKIPGQLGKLYADATKEVKDKYGGIVPRSKQAQYTADIEAAYRKRAQAVGLGQYLDMYSPSATNAGFNLVQSLPKGAKIVDPFAEG